LLVLKLALLYDRSTGNPARAVQQAQKQAMTAPKYKRLSPEARAGELVQAGLKVLARGGITAFTIDNICKASGASRGLIGHHFGNKDALLTACYAAAYAPLLQGMARPGAVPRLPELIDDLLSDRQFHREGLNIWLALWGEIAVNPALRAEHLRQYDRYHQAIAAAINTHALAQGRNIDAAALATSLIALLDGLWVEICIAPDRMSQAGARKAVESLLIPHLGPLG
jgi:TetR/AcrR family transcriptional regulator, transcriptional repressor of bet genes